MAPPGPSLIIFGTNPLYRARNLKIRWIKRHNPVEDKLPFFLVDHCNYPHGSSVFHYTRYRLRTFGEKKYQDRILK